MKPFPKHTFHSAKTGQFVSPKAAKRRPATTVRVRSKCKQAKRGRR